MNPFTVIFLNVVVWGTAFTYYYLLYLLSKKGEKVYWFGGPQALGHYGALFRVIREEPNAQVRRRVSTILWVHFGCLAGMFVSFALIVAERISLAQR